MKPMTVVLVFLVCSCVVPALFAQDLMKCGTPEALRAFWAGEELERPPFGQDTVSSRHFVVHFDTTGDHATTRAYAESVSVYAECSWRMQVDTLGWIEPPSDGAGGDDRYGNSGDAIMDP